MPTVPVYNMDGQPVGEMALDDAVFAAPVNRTLLHQAVVAYLANRRQGTHATRTRGQVSGGGRKPWRQKHTGRARQGSIRAPHWKGGGVVFGPHPRDYRQRLPVALRRAALRGALSVKAAGGALRVLDRLAFERPRTREFVRVLRNLGLEDQRALVVTAGHDPVVYLSARNVEDVRVQPAADLNAYEVLRARTVILTQDAVRAVEEALAR
jgi:large subunit ribosomal protein L4